MCCTTPQSASRPAPQPWGALNVSTFMDRDKSTLTIQIIIVKALPGFSLERVLKERSEGGWALYCSYTPSGQIPHICSCPVRGAPSRQPRGSRDSRSSRFKSSISKVISFRNAPINRPMVKFFFTKIDRWSIIFYTGTNPTKEDLCSKKLQP